MKRIFYFFPAILALLAYLALAYTSGLYAINPYVWICISLMFISAIVMLNGKWYGCLAGFGVGIVLIYMSTQYTGQVIEIEMPLGIVLCVFYLISGIFTKKRRINR